MKSEKELDFINVGKTAEAMKSAGFFIMFEHGGNHYAMTETFILRCVPSPMQAGGGMFWRVVSESEGLHSNGGQKGGD